MQALYRKWRPQKFSELLGQDHVRDTLRSALAGGRFVHAYLFAGPRGCGKTTTARLLAKGVNCLNLQNGEPCNQCSSCLEIQKGQSMDLIEIDAASNRGIEEIRDLREKVKFAPTKSKYKVYVIDEVHQLTREAFNALLKTLEEPPSHVIFVLATTEPYKIPKTILSRCQRFDFKRVGIADLIKRLDYIAEQEGLRLDEESKKLLAQTAAGSVRDVESSLDTVLGKGLTTITKKDVEEILGRTELERIEQLYHFLVKKDVSSALSLLNQIIEEGKDLNQFTVDLVEFLREKLIKNPSPVLASWIRTIADAQQKMKTAHITQLPLELAIVEIAYKKENEEKSNEVKEDDPEPKVDPPKQKAQDTNQEIDIDWEQVVAQIRPHNHSLCFLLKGSQPLEIQDGQIILGVSFKFHKDKLEEVKNRRLIEEVIKKVTGRDLKLACRVVKNLEKAMPEERDLIKEVTEVFEI